MFDIFFQAEDDIRYWSVTVVQTCFFFFQAEDGIRDWSVTGVQTCALPILVRFPSESFADSLLSFFSETSRAMIAATSGEPTSSSIAVPTSSGRRSNTFVLSHASSTSERGGNGSKRPRPRSWSQ